MWDKRNFYKMFYMSQWETNNKIEEKPKVLCWPYLRWNEYIIDEPAIMGYTYVHGLQDTDPTIDIEKSWKEYLSTFNVKYRSNLLITSTLSIVLNTSVSPSIEDTTK